MLKDFDVGTLKEAFKKEVEHIQKRSRKNTVKVEKGFFTKEKMRKVLGWSANLISSSVTIDHSIHMICSKDFKGNYIIPPYGHVMLYTIFIYRLCAKEANQGCVCLLHPQVQGEDPRQAS